jgi:hypothetical protein
MVLMCRCLFGRKESVINLNREIQGCKTVTSIEAANTDEKKRIAAEAKRGVEQFLSLEILRVQDGGNVRREQLLRSLAPYADDDMLDAFRLPSTSAARAREEITRPFQLVTPPDPIIISLELDSFAAKPNAGAFIVLNPAPEHKGVIFVL